MLTGGVLKMSGATNGTIPNGKMRLLDAALVIERLQGRAAHAGEVEALRIARDALLIIVAEGHATLADRLSEATSQARRLGAA